jgi:hypothetical protein
VVVKKKCFGQVGTYEEFENIVIGSHLQPMKDDVTALDLKRSNWDSSGRSKSRARRRDLGAGDTCFSTLRRNLFAAV